jgi:predicted phage tail protein
VSDVTAESAKLAWEKPEDDGGEPIDHYVVERMDVETGRWVPVTTTKGTEAEVPGLTEGHQYQFRVRAVNAEGQGEPLETDKPTLAKNPFGSFHVDAWLSHSSLFKYDMTYNMVIHNMTI